MIFMLKIQEKANQFIADIKKQNPDANWANLFTGIGILVMLAVFSIWYFSNSNTINLEQLDQKDTDQSANDTKVKTDTSKDASKNQLKADETTVNAGEGLWQVAERVCGDGEKYVALAQGNGLTEWSELYTGQVLKIICEIK